MSDSWTVRLDPRDPMTSAREYLLRSCTAYGYDLVYIGGRFLLRRDGVETPCAMQELRAHVWRFLAVAVRYERRIGHNTPYQPTPANVTAVIDALAALVYAGEPRGIR